MSAESQEVKLIVFDMGHVFVDFEWEEIRNTFAAKANNPSETQVKNAFVQLGQLGYESGQITTADFVQEMNRILGTNLTVDEFKAIWTLTFRENKDMAALMTALKAQVPLYLLSNTNEIHYDFLQANYQVARHFSQLILSYKLGCTKPAQRIYQEVLNLSGHVGSNCLFIDDLEVNIKAASEFGIQTIHFQGIEDLKTRLLNFGFVV
jgi:putative hydrolase of the HAD superfamily